MKAPQDEFYVGYLPQAPARVGGFVTRIAVVLVLLGVGVAAALPAFLKAAPAKVFEWGEPRTFIGWLDEEGQPTLAVRRPGQAEEDQAWSHFLLVGPGKMGANAHVGDLSGQLVRLDGALIYHEGRTMLEVVPGSVEAMNGEGGSPPNVAVEPLGEHTLVGEIVDSKCYLGVMAPGATKPHRACATRCISGGIPPVFLVREASGRAVYLLLVSASGESVNEAVLPLVAEPLEIRGQVERRGDMLILKSDPSTYRRIAE